MQRAQMVFRSLYRAPRRKCTGKVGSERKACARVAMISRGRMFCGRRDAGGEGWRIDARKCAPRYLLAR